MGLKIEQGAMPPTNVASPLGGSYRADPARADSLSKQVCFDAEKSFVSRGFEKIGDFFRWINSKIWSFLGAIFFCCIKKKGFNVDELKKLQGEYQELLAFFNKNKSDANFANAWRDKLEVAPQMKEALLREFYREEANEKKRGVEDLDVEDWIERSMKDPAKAASFVVSLEGIADSDNNVYEPSVMVPRFINTVLTNIQTDIKAKENKN